jgi:hypothetical protein
MAANISDKMTLRDFAEGIEGPHGKARRTWVMDRGVQPRRPCWPICGLRDVSHYLVGTLCGRRIS